MWKRKFKIFFLDHWVKLAVVAFMVLAIWWPMHVLGQVDSYQRTNLIAWLSLAPIQAVVHSAIFVVLLYWLHFGGGFQKIAKKRIKSNEVNVRWADVIGMDQAKLEALEVVKLLKDHARVQKIGGKMIRGILMMGPPGCGKTYLAKAIATEAGMPFVSMSASEFVEMYVGVGASRVRQIFKKARRLAYAEGGCIVFIDEIDAIARARTFNQFGGHEETNSTQNQLLSEMDGLGDKTDNVVILGATNAPEHTLDPALLRPGRFDRKIHIMRPDAIEREAIFKYYLSKVKFDSKIDVARIARKAIYKTPSDISNIVQEAALISSRDGKDAVDYRDMMNAMDRIDLGFKHKVKMSPRERKMTAYHEAGHAVVGYYLYPDFDINYATIIKRGGALGHVQPVAIEELFTRDRDSLLAQIKVSLAGYAAEKFKFNVTTSGVEMDFAHALKIASHMVWKWGMGKTGYLGNYTELSEELVSDDIRKKLNEESNAIIGECLKETDEVLRRESVVFEKFATELLEREELDYDQITEIFDKFGTKTPRKLRKDDVILE